MKRLSQESKHNKKHSFTDLQETSTSQFHNIPFTTKSRDWKLCTRLSTLPSKSSENFFNSKLGENFSANIYHFGPNFCIATQIAFGLTFKIYAISNNTQKG